MEFSHLLAELKNASEEYGNTKSKNAIATIEFCQTVCKVADSFEKQITKYENQVIGLWVIYGYVTEIYPQLDQGSATHSLGQKLFGVSARIVLDVQWGQLEENEPYKNNFKNTLTAFHEILLDTEAKRRFSAIISLMETHWCHPILGQVMSSEEDDDEEKGIKYICAEDPDILRLRVEMMLQQNCEEFALNLCTWCLKHPALKYDLDIRQIQLTLMNKLHDLDRIQEEAETIPPKDCVALVKRFLELPNLNKICTVLTQSFLVQNWIKQGNEEYTIELLRLWIKHQYMEDQDEDTFISNSWAIAKLSRTTEQITVIIDCIREKCGDSLLQFYTDMCIYAINIDKSVMEKSIQNGDMSEIRTHQQDMALTCNKLSNIFRKHCLKTARYSVVTAFSLSPSQKSLDRVESFYKSDNPMELIDTGQNISELCCGSCTFKQGHCSQKNKDCDNEANINPATLYEVERLLNMLRPYNLKPEMDWKVLGPACAKFLQERERILALMKEAEAKKNTQPNQPSHQHLTDSLHEKLLITGVHNKPLQQPVPKPPPPPKVETKPEKVLGYANNLQQVVENLQKRLGKSPLIAQSPKKVGPRTAQSINLANNAVNIMHNYNVNSANMLPTASQILAKKKSDAETIRLRTSQQIAATIQQTFLRNHDDVSQKPMQKVMVRVHNYEQYPQNPNVPTSSNQIKQIANRPSIQQVVRSPSVANQPTVNQQYIMSPQISSIRMIKPQQKTLNQKQSVLTNAQFNQMTSNRIPSTVLQQPGISSQQCSNIRIPGTLQYSNIQMQGKDQIRTQGTVIPKQQTQFTARLPNQLLRQQLVGSNVQVNTIRNPSAANLQAGQFQSTVTSQQLLNIQAQIKQQASIVRPVKVAVHHVTGISQKTNIPSTRVTQQIQGNIQQAAFSTPVQSYTITPALHGLTQTQKIITPQHLQSGQIAFSSAKYQTVNNQALATNITIVPGQGVQNMVSVSSSQKSQPTLMQQPPGSQLYKDMKENQMHKSRGLTISSSSALQATSALADHSKLKKQLVSSNQVHLLAQTEAKGDASGKAVVRILQSQGGIQKPNLNLTNSIGTISNPLPYSPGTKSQVLAINQQLVTLSQPRVQQTVNQGVQSYSSLPFSINQGVSLSRQIYPKNHPGVATLESVSNSQKMTFPVGQTVLTSRGAPLTEPVQTDLNTLLTVASSNARSTNLPTVAPMQTTTSIFQSLSASQSSLNQLSSIQSDLNSIIPTIPQLDSHQFQDMQNQIKASQAQHQISTPNISAQQLQEELNKINQRSHQHSSNQTQNVPVSRTQYPYAQQVSIGKQKVQFATNIKQEKGKLTHPSTRTIVKSVASVPRKSSPASSTVAMSGPKSDASISIHRSSNLSLQKMLNQTAVNQSVQSQSTNQQNLVTSVTSIASQESAEEQKNIFVRSLLNASEEILETLAALPDTSLITDMFNNANPGDELHIALSDNLEDFGMEDVSSLLLTGHERETSGAEKQFTQPHQIESASYAAKLPIDPQDSNYLAAQSLHDVQGIHIPELHQHFLPMTENFNDTTGKYESNSVCDNISKNSVTKETQNMTILPSSVTALEPASFQSVNEEVNLETATLRANMSSKKSGSVYKCIICSSEFTTLDSLQLHVQRVCKHEGVPNNSMFNDSNSNYSGMTAKSIYQCVKCQSILISEKEMQRHTKICPENPTNNLMLKPTSHFQAKIGPQSKNYPCVSKLIAKHQLEINREKDEKLKMKREKEQQMKKLKAQKVLQKQKELRIKREQQAAMNTPRYKEMTSSSGKMFYKCELCGQTFCSPEGVHDHWLPCLKKNPIKKKIRRHESVPHHRHNTVENPERISEIMLDIFDTVVGASDKEDRIKEASRSDVKTAYDETVRMEIDNDVKMSDDKHVKITDDSTGEGSNTNSQESHENEEDSKESKEEKSSDEEKCNKEIKQKAFSKENYSNKERKGKPSNKDNDENATSDEQDDGSAKEMSTEEDKEISTEEDKEISTEEDKEQMEDDTDGTDTMEKSRNLRHRKNTKVPKYFFSSDSDEDLRQAKKLSQIESCEDNQPVFPEIELARLKKSSSCLVCSVKLKDLTIKLQHFAVKHLKIHTHLKSRSGHSFLCHLCQDKFNVYTKYVFHLKNHETEILKGILKMMSINDSSNSNADRQQSVQMRLQMLAARKSVKKHLSPQKKPFHVGVIEVKGKRGRPRKTGSEEIVKQTGVSTRRTNVRAAHRQALNKIKNNANGFDILNTLPDFNADLSSSSHSRSCSPEQAEVSRRQTRSRRTVSTHEDIKENTDDESSQVEQSENTETEEISQESSQDDDVTLTDLETDQISDSETGTIESTDQETTDPDSLQKSNYDDAKDSESSVSNKLAAAKADIKGLSFMSSFLSFLGDRTEEPSEIKHFKNYKESMFKEPPKIPSLPTQLSFTATANQTEKSCQRPIIFKNIKKYKQAFFMSESRNPYLPKSVNAARHSIGEDVRSTQIKDNDVPTKPLSRRMSDSVLLSQHSHLLQDNCELRVILEKLPQSPSKTDNVVGHAQESTATIDGVFKQLFPDTDDASSTPTDISMRSESKETFVDNTSKAKSEEDDDRAIYAEPDDNTSTAKSELVEVLLLNATSPSKLISSFLQTETLKPAEKVYISASDKLLNKTSMEGQDILKTVHLQESQYDQHLKFRSNVSKDEEINIVLKNQNSFEIHSNDEHNIHSISLSSGDSQDIINDDVEMKHDNILSSGIGDEHVIVDGSLTDCVLLKANTPPEGHSRSDIIIIENTHGPEEDMSVDSDDNEVIPAVAETNVEIIVNNVAEIIEGAKISLLNKTEIETTFTLTSNETVTLPEYTNDAPPSCCTTNSEMNRVKESLLEHNRNDFEIIIEQEDKQNDMLSPNSISLAEVVHPTKQNVADENETDVTETPVPFITSDTNSEYTSNMLKEDIDRLGHTALLQNESTYQNIFNNENDMNKKVPCNLGEESKDETNKSIFPVPVKLTKREPTSLELRDVSPSNDTITEIYESNLTISDVDINPTGNRVNDASETDVIQCKSTEIDQKIISKNKKRELLEMEDKKILDSVNTSEAGSQHVDLSYDDPEIMLNSETDIQPYESLNVIIIDECAARANEILTAPEDNIELPSDMNMTKPSVEVRCITEPIVEVGIRLDDSIETDNKVVAADQFQTYSRFVNKTQEVVDMPAVKLKPEVVDQENEDTSTKTVESSVKFYSPSTSIISNNELSTKNNTALISVMESLPIPPLNTSEITPLVPVSSEETESINTSQLQGEYKESYAKHISATNNSESYSIMEQTSNQSEDIVENVSKTPDQAVGETITQNVKKRSSTNVHNEEPTPCLYIIETQELLQKETLQETKKAADSCPVKRKNNTLSTKIEKETPATDTKCCKSVATQNLSPNQPKGNLQKTEFKETMKEIEKTNDSLPVENTNISLKPEIEILVTDTKQVNGGVAYHEAPSSNESKCQKKETKKDTDSYPGKNSDNTKPSVNIEKGFSDKDTRYVRSVAHSIKLLRSASKLGTASSTNIGVKLVDYSESDSELDIELNENNCGESACELNKNNDFIDNVTEISLEVQTSSSVAVTLNFVDKELIPKSENILSPSEISKKFASLSDRQKLSSGVHSVMAESGTLDNSLACKSPVFMPKNIPPKSLLRESLEKSNTVGSLEAKPMVISTNSNIFFAQPKESIIRASSLFETKPVELTVVTEKGCKKKDSSSQTIVKSKISHQVHKLPKIGHTVTSASGNKMTVVDVQIREPMQSPSDPCTSPEVGKRSGLIQSLREQIQVEPFTWDDDDEDIKKKKKNERACQAIRDQAGTAPFTWDVSESDQSSGESPIKCQKQESKQEEKRSEKQTLVTGRKQIIVKNISSDVKQGVEVKVIKEQHPTQAVPDDASSSHTSSLSKSNIETVKRVVNLTTSSTQASLTGRKQVGVKNISCDIKEGVEVKFCKKYSSQNISDVDTKPSHTSRSSQARVETDCKGFNLTTTSVQTSVTERKQIVKNISPIVKPGVEVKTSKEQHTSQDGDKKLISSHTSCLSQVEVETVKKVLDLKTNSAQKYPQNKSIRQKFETQTNQCRTRSSSKSSPRSNEHQRSHRLTPSKYRRSSPTKSLLPLKKTFHQIRLTDNFSSPVGRSAINIMKNINSELKSPPQITSKQPTTNIDETVVRRKTKSLPGDKSDELLNVNDKLCKRENSDSESEIPDKRQKTLVESSCEASSVDTTSPIRRSKRHLERLHRKLCCDEDHTIKKRKLSDLKCHHGPSSTCSSCVHGKKSETPLPAVVRRSKNYCRHSYQNISKDAAKPFLKERTKRSQVLKTVTLLRVESDIPLKDLKGVPKCQMNKSGDHKNDQDNKWRFRPRNKNKKYPFTFTRAREKE